MPANSTTQPLLLTLVFFVSAVSAVSAVAAAQPVASGPTATLAKCQAVVAAADAAKLPKKSAELTRSKPKRCFETALATYALLPASFSPSSPDSRDQYKLVWQLAKIHPSGAATPYSVIPVAASTAQSPSARALAKSHPARKPLTDVQVPGEDSSLIYVERITDLNGDGNPEVLVVTNYEQYEIASVQILEIWTIRSSGTGSELIPYPAAPPVSALTEQQLEGNPLIVDVDGDGRPDLHTDGPYHNIKELAAGANELINVVPAWFLLHGTPSGTFVGNDAVAKSELARRCPEPPVLDAPYRKTRNFLQEVVCARAFGQSEQQVLTRLVPHCAAMAKDDVNVSLGGPRAKNGCPRWLVEAAAVTPPVSLR